MELKIEPTEALLSMVLREPWPFQFLALRRCSLAGLTEVHPKRVRKGEDPSGKHGQVQSPAGESGDWAEAIMSGTPAMQPATETIIGTKELEGVR